MKHRALVWITITLTVFLFQPVQQLQAAQSDLRVSFSRASYFVKEGDTAEIGLRLSALATEPVTVRYTVFGSNAIPNIDFEPLDGEVVIPAGTNRATIEFSTLLDQKADGDKRILLSLTSADNAVLANRRQAILNIKDNDVRDDAIVDDFEGYHPFQLEGAVSGATQIASLPGSDAAQQAFVLNAIDGRTMATVTRRFVMPQNWMDSEGISFWFHGNGSGQPITFQLLDNLAFTTAETDAADWELIWADEFDASAGTPPNPNHWSYEYGDGSLNGVQGWGNQEAQYYTSDTENVAMDGEGNLAITVQKLPDDTALSCYYGTCTHTSARLISANKAEFEYGRIEARIKVPDGPGGLWPAFWMLGTGFDEGVSWPTAGEIDIMEYISRRPNEVFGTIHGPGYFGGNGYGRIQQLGEPVANDYHTYAIEWKPDEIRWFLDGEHFHTATPDKVAPNEWVYNQPFFLLLNVAIGGNFGGRISPNIEYPQSMLVDYIRVYQAPDTAERFEVTFADTEAGWQQIQIPFSLLTRGAQQPTNALNDGLNLDAVSGYRFVLPALSDEIGIDEVRLHADPIEAKIPAAPMPNYLPWLLLLCVGFVVGLTIFNRRFNAMNS